jgi:hypothetical protein
MVKELDGNEFMIWKKAYSTQNKSGTPLMCGLMKINPTKREATFAGILVPSSIMFLFFLIVLFFVPILFFPPKNVMPFLYYLIPLGFVIIGYMTYKLQAKEFDRIIEILAEVTT